MTERDVETLKELAQGKGLLLSAFERSLENGNWYVVYFPDDGGDGDSIESKEYKTLQTAIYREIARLSK